MSTASLQMLKGAKKSLNKELETAPVQAAEPEAPADAETEEVTIDVDKMTGKELDALVADETNGIVVPGDWKKMKVDEKRAWLKATFNDDGSTDAAEEVAEAEEPEAEDAPAEEPAAAPAEAPKKGKLTMKAKGSAVAKPAKSGEVMGPDQISDIASEIENLKEAEARGMVEILSEQTELTYFKLGGVLSLLQTNGWFAPYANFREFVEGEHGINYRKAMYLISIYNNIIESKVPYEKVKHLGWTKLKEIASILTIDNMDKWIETAEKHTALQLAHLVMQAKKADQSALPSDAPQSSAVTTKTFKLHAEQKETVEAALTKAKKAANTDVDTVALEFICLEYINTSNKKAATPPDLKKLMEGKSAEDVLNIFTEVFPDVGLTVEI